MKIAEHFLFFSAGKSLHSQQERVWNPNHWALTAFCPSHYTAPMCTAGKGQMTEAVFSFPCRPSGILAAFIHQIEIRSVERTPRVRLRWDSPRTQWVLRLSDGTPRPEWALFHQPVCADESGAHRYCGPSLWEQFFNSQRMGHVFLGACPACRLHLQGKSGMKKQEQQIMGHWAKSLVLAIQGCCHLLAGSGCAKVRGHFSSRNILHWGKISPGSKLQQGVNRSASG